MIKTAVILAGGYGRRMKLFEKPKGFLNIAGKPLIEYSIDALLAHGIEKIVIGTGFRADFYSRLEKKYSQVVTECNADFATSGSLVTFLRLADHITEDFLLLESDLLYDSSCLTSVLQDTHENSLLLSHSENDRDGVFVQIDSGGNLVRMSKEPRYLTAPEDGILVGITKMSLNTYKEFLKVGAETLKTNYLEHYDFIFEHLQSKFFLLNVPNLIFTEIDDDVQLEYALNVIYPKLTLGF
jgi:2-aminoethylphosphonate-pyruvate transaminase